VAAAAGEAISPRYPTSRWPEGVVVGDRVLLPVDAAMPGGSMLLVVEVLDGQAGAPLGRVERAIEVAPEAAPFRPALEGIEARAGVSYGGEVRLLGVTARQEGEALVLDLAWLALRAMDRRFKVFVHLLDKEGVIAAQHDAMPRDWSYPTTLWGRGEVYVDRVSLDASGAPPGAYRLAVGVYAPGEDRLPAVDAAGALLADGRAVLALEIEVTGP